MEYRDSASNSSLVDVDLLATDRWFCSRACSNCSIDLKGLCALAASDNAVAKASAMLTGLPGSCGAGRAEKKLWEEKASAASTSSARWSCLSEAALLCDMPFTCCPRAAGK